MSLRQFWEDRLKTFYDKYSESDRIVLFNIINKFECEEVYNPKVSEHDIFNHLYNKQNSHDAEITAKRQPNPFMVFRTALGMTAAHKNVKLGDGTSQSRTAGLMWRGARPNEKKNFENLSSLFKDLHKQKFPMYEYKPKQRNPIAGTFVDMSNNNFVTGSNNQSIPQQSHIHQQIQSIPKDNNVTILDQLASLEYHTTEFDPVFMNLGGMPYQPEIYVPQQPYLPEEFYQTNLLNNVNMLNKVEYPQQIPPPSIAENCPNQYDINNGSFFLDNNNTFTNTNYYPYFYYQQ